MNGLRIPHSGEAGRQYCQHLLATMRARFRPSGSHGYCSGAARGKARRHHVLILVAFMGLVGWLRWNMVLLERVSPPETVAQMSCSLAWPSHSSVVLVLTPSPEADMLGVQQALSTDGAATLVLNEVYTADRSLLTRKKKKTWKDPPEWLGYDFAEVGISVKTRIEFENQVCAILQNNQGTNRLILHSPLLVTTVGVWLETLDNLGIEVEIAFARRVTFQAQVYSAIDHLSEHRVSATEFATIFAQSVIRELKRLALIRPFIVLERHTKTGWRKVTDIGFSATFDDDYPTERKMFEEALSAHSPDITNKFEKPKLIRRDDEVYVSIVTASKPLLETKNGSAVPVYGIKGSDGRESEYTKGIIGLGRSITFFDTTRERILLVTDTPFQDHQALKQAAYRGGWTLMLIPPIPDRWFSPACKHSPARAHQNVRWGLMASKLRILDLKKKAVLYMDLDIVVTSRVDRLFNASPPEYVMISEGGIQHKYLNAGFLFARPSSKLFNDMIEYYNTHDPPTIFRNLIDCTEMGLINAFFGIPDSLVENGDVLQLGAPSPEAQPNGRTARLPLNSTSLYIGRPDVPRSTLPLAYHFIRKDLCPKPWSADCERVARCKPSSDIDDDQPECYRLYKFRRCDRKAYQAFCRFQGHTTELD